MSLIDIRCLTFAYEGSYENIFEELSLQLDSSWKLGLVGRNGRGKSTLLRLLAGTLPHGGAVSMPLEPVYFPAAVSHPEEETRSVLEKLAPELDRKSVV